MDRTNVSQLQSFKPAGSQPLEALPQDKFIVWAAKIEVSLLRQSLIIEVLGVFIIFGLFLANYSLNWAD